MTAFIAEFSKRFDTFNEDIIKARIRDPIIPYLEDLAHEIERNFPHYVKYLGHTFDDSTRKVREISKGKEKKKKKKRDNETLIGIDSTYARLAVFSFKISYGGKQSVVQMPIYIPLLVDDYHYMIRGNKYSAPFQLTEALTHNSVKSNDYVILKTLTRPIKMGRKKDDVKDVHGDVYSGHSFQIHMSRKKIPFLLYYFAQYGFESTFRYFGARDEVSFLDGAPIEPDPEFSYFRFGRDLYIKVPRQRMKESLTFRNFIISVLSVAKRTMDLETVTRADRWKMVLGSYMTQSVAYEKGKDMISSFQTALDIRTLNNINKFTVTPYPKTNIFDVVRWMFVNFPALSAKNTSIHNKRLRISEYLVAPVTRYVMNNVYRFLKQRNKEIDHLEDIFKVRSTILLDAIIGKTKGKGASLGIAKYTGSVNDMDLVNSALQMTQAGPNSPIEELGKMAGVEYRLFDPTFVGSVDIITTSNGMVGITGVLTAHAKIDVETMRFKPD